MVVNMHDLTHACNIELRLPCTDILDIPSYTPYLRKASPCSVFIRAMLIGGDYTNICNK